MRAVFALLVAFGLDTPLIRLLADLVDAVDHIHAGDDLGERGEIHAWQSIAASPNGANFTQMGPSAQSI